jgi:ankyrin repeat protein
MSADPLGFDFTSMGDLSQYETSAQSGSPASVSPMPRTRYSVSENALVSKFHATSQQRSSSDNSSHVHCVDCIRESLDTARTRTAATIFPQETTLPSTPSLISTIPDLSLDLSQTKLPPIVTRDQYLDLSLLDSPSTNSMSITSSLIGNTAIHQACHNGHTNVVKLLLDRGVSSLETNGAGQTILHVACAKGHINMVRMLLHRGLDMEQKDYSGMSPLYLAASNGHTDIVGILIDQGASTVTRCD